MAEESKRPNPALSAQRVANVASGLYLMLRATDKDVARSAGELDDDERQALRDMASGLIKVWDGLNASER